MNNIFIRCAWCGTDMGEKEPYDNKDITHSICRRCETEHFPENQKRWNCQFCPETLLNYKLLIEHYESEHPQELKHFQVVHRKTKASGLVMATNSEEACEFFGWNSQDCTIKVIE